MIAINSCPFGEKTSSLRMNPFVPIALLIVNELESQMLMTLP